MLDRPPFSSGHKTLYNMMLLQATVDDLKGRLEPLADLPKVRQRLIYKGRVLQDSQTLAEVGVENGHSLHLVDRPPNADVPPPGSAAGGASAAGAAAGAGADPFAFLQNMMAGQMPGGIPLGMQSVQISSTNIPLGVGEAAGEQRTGTLPQHLFRLLSGRKLVGCRQAYTKTASETAANEIIVGLPLSHAPVRRCFFCVVLVAANQNCCCCAGCRHISRLPISKQ